MHSFATALTPPLGVVVLGVVVLFRTTSCLGVVMLRVVMLRVVMLRVVLGAPSATTSLRGNYRTNRSSRGDRCGTSGR
jgi:hypothetical protein